MMLTFFLIAYAIGWVTIGGLFAAYAACTFQSPGKPMRWPRLFAFFWSGMLWPVVIYQTIRGG